MSEAELERVSIDSYEERNSSPSLPPSNNIAMYIGIAATPTMRSAAVMPIRNKAVRMRLTAGLLVKTAVISRLEKMMQTATTSYATIQGGVVTGSIARILGLANGKLNNLPHVSHT